MSNCVAAPIGNQYGLALKDPIIRQKAYDSFCAHLSKGKSIRSWWYEDEEGNSCYWETMLSYIKNNPREFDPIKKKIAETKGYQYWEEIAELSAKGENEANTPSLQMIMRNKFGWDKEQPKEKDNDSLLKAIKDAIADSKDNREIPRTEEASRSNMETEQSLLYQRHSGEENQVQFELGTERDSEHSSSV